MQITNHKERYKELRDSLISLDVKKVEMLLEIIESKELVFRKTLQTFVEETISRVKNGQKLESGDIERILTITESLLKAGAHVVKEVESKWSAENKLLDALIMNKAGATEEATLINMLQKIIRKSDGKNIATEVVNKIVQMGNLDIAFSLLDAGFDPNEAEPLAVKWAQKGYPYEIDDLVKRGCKLTSSADSALTKAIKYGRSQMVSHLIKEHGMSLNAEGACSVFETAVTFGRFEILEDLCRLGGDVLAEDESSEKGLLRCACEGSSDTIVEWLLAKGCKPKKRDALLSIFCGNRGMAVTKKRRIEILSQLIGAGARIDGKDVNGETALMLMIDREDNKSVSFLLEKGASVTVKNEMGETPLAFALKKVNLKAVEELLKYKADPNERKPNNKTMLHIAAGRVSEKAMNLLMDHGADVNSVDNRNRTALMIYLDNGGESEEIAERMLKSGMDPTLKDKDGRGLSDYVERSGGMERILVIARAAEEMESLAQDITEQKKKKKTKRI